MHALRSIRPLVVMAASLASVLCMPNLCARALGRDIFVNNITGSDLALGVEPVAGFPIRGPVRTLARALWLVEPGDRVSLADTGEPYRESVALEGTRFSGAPGEAFVLSGGGAVLSGDRPTPDAAWKFVDGIVFRYRPMRLGYQQLFSHGRPLPRRPIVSPLGSRPELKPLEWCLDGGYIYLAVEPGHVPQDYALSVCDLPTGVLINQARRVVIENLTIQGFQLDGVNAHDGAIRVELRGLTVRGNGRSGARVAGSSRVELVDCVVGDNGAAQLLVNGYSRAEAFRCELIPNTAPAFVERGGLLWIDGRRASE